MSKKKEISKESYKSFFNKPLMNMAIGSYKGEVFQYVSRENCIVTSKQGELLYKEDLRSNATVIVATNKHFIFVKSNLLPKTIECFPNQPEEWVQELLGSSISPEV